MFKLADGIGTLKPFKIFPLHPTLLSQPSFTTGNTFEIMYNSAVAFFIPHLYSQNGILSMGWTEMGGNNQKSQRAMFEEYKIRLMTGIPYFLRKSESVSMKQLKNV